MCPTGTPVPRSCSNALSWHRGGRTTNAYAQISSARSICTNARHPIWSRFTHRKSRNVRNTLPKVWAPTRTGLPDSPTSRRSDAPDASKRSSRLTQPLQTGCIRNSPRTIWASACIRTILPQDPGLGPSPITRHSHIDQRSISIRQSGARCTYVRGGAALTPNPSPVSNGRGVSWGEGGLASLRARVGPGNVGPDPERPWRPASARGSGVVIPDIILARAPPGTKCPGSRGKAH
jgi:hypothetical protein